MAFQVTEVQKALKGIDYPADNDKLVETAKSNGAPDDLLGALSGLDKNSYDGPNAVMAAMKGNLGGES